MPDSMEAYVALKDSLFMDSSQLARQPSFRIYAFINVSCASCIPEVDTWNIEAHDFIKYRVPIILICTTKDNFEYIKYLFENRKLKKFPYPLYLDIKNLFYKQNSFINRDLTKQAVLVDNNNTIVASGNPIDSDEIKSMYINKIKSK